MNVTVKDADSVMANILGRRIIDGRESKDGLHVEFDNGMVLIFTGEFVIAVYNNVEKALH